MLYVFGETNTKEAQVQLPNGRKMSLEELLSEYVILKNEKNSKKDITSEPNKEISKEAITSESNDDQEVTSKLKVGEWFLIDRAVIDKHKEEIKRKCNEAEDESILLWSRFEKSNKIADENSDYYTRLIETYIFKHNWDYKTEQEMRDMCEDKGDGMADEIICDLELQMRICNGESLHKLLKEPDELPRERLIEFRDGETGCFGGGAVNINFNPPANLKRYNVYPNFKFFKSVPYAFRRVPSQN